MSHAIVLGAGMAGLFNAAVLARHFTRVTVIERDLLEDTSEARKGVPQGRHVHGFWRRGMRVVEELLPGVRAELEHSGAVPGDCGSDFLWHQFGVTKVREAAGIPALLATRPHLEAFVRRRVAALDNVHLKPGTRVLQLMADGVPGQRTVRGVKVANETQAEQHIEADLVVDATGRAGFATQWLEELGYTPPAESKVRIDLTYVTCLFHRKPKPGPIAYVVVTTPPEGKRAGVAFAVEGDRWLISLLGFMGEEPPQDLPGFIAYARSLPVPNVYDIAASCEPTCTPARFKFPQNLRRHYERMQRFPGGFLVTGDALTSFNPTYGQGMTVAALEAEALDKELSRRAALRPLHARFFRRTAKIIDVPWSLRTGDDLRYPEATGRRPIGIDIMNAYATRLHQASAYDARVCQAFLKVASFEALPPSLFAPSIIWRVLRPRPTHFTDVTLSSR